VSAIVVLRLQREAAERRRRLLLNSKSGAGPIDDDKSGYVKAEENDNGGDSGNAFIQGQVLERLGEAEQHLAELEARRTDTRRELLNLVDQIELAQRRIADLKKRAAL